MLHARMNAGWLPLKFVGGEAAVDACMCGSRRWSRRRLGAAQSLLPSLRWLAERHEAESVRTFGAGMDGLRRVDRPEASWHTDHCTQLNCMRSQSVSLCLS